MAIKTELKFTNATPQSLIPYEKNARTHDETQIKQICDSILQFGFTNPILVSEKMEVIAGHGRLQAALILDLKSVPIIVIEGLTEQQRRAYVIADNKIALNSGWDEDLLFEELMFLEDSEFNLDVLGFSDKELEEMMPAMPDLQDGFTGSAGKDTFAAAGTSGVVGPYRFPIEREAFKKWETEIQKKVGLDKNSIIAEIQKRLGL